jgi:hypothetical protein
LVIAAGDASKVVPNGALALIIGTAEDTLEGSAPLTYTQIFKKKGPHYPQGEYQWDTKGDTAAIEDSVARQKSNGAPQRRRHHPTSSRCKSLE